MERLTGNDNKFFQDGMDEHKVSAVYFKLKAYEDAEEQGMLVRLPCNRGDVVYCIAGRWDRRTVVERTCLGISIVGKNVLVKTGDGAMGYELGKTIFLTREEADAALKEANRDG